MNIEFKSDIRNSIDIENSNTIVIVSNDCNKEFIANTLNKIIGTNSLCNEITNLDYNKIYRFNLYINNKIKEIIIVGAGNQNTLTLADVEKLGGYIYSQVQTERAVLTIFNNISYTGLEAASAYLASGLYLKSWKFDKYLTQKNTCKIPQVTCLTQYVQINQIKWNEIIEIDNSVFTVREMVSEPANVMNSETIKNIALNLSEYGVKVRILDKKDMAKLGMNALLGVNSGSDNPPYTVVLEYLYNTSNKNDVISLVGKGVTFDAGGISLKPANKMGEMKGDMTGAAVVLGTIQSLARQKLPVNVVGAFGLVENMISGSAQRPGDVVKSMAGTFIEVDNTDAEGRLVLADVLWYVQQTYKPSIIIDFATLTGAIQVALGHEFAGYFANNDELAQQLEKSSRKVGEKIWRLPLHKSYEPDIKSEIADIKNVGSGRGGGSITAAVFLQKFIQNATQWAHIDVAATEWDSKNRALSQVGATGFGVRLMNDFIKNRIISHKS